MNCQEDLFFLNKFTYNKGNISRGIQEICPHCQRKITDNIFRVTGYYGHVNNWSPGKVREYGERHRYRVEYR
ncbi:anaerobic ribonucleoside-triphosphate reductase [Methanolobus bombayensis]|uniref:anaerobic ribonucleoside-triphosphate reductase n=1 Tax=Methanolobus bombayensis TaxID=38023 RepID=UPI001AE9CA1D|nr:anaerobic ribonucleoside-triphosphate reductase [Methanolobus bombayensis]MBP1908111.1 anaerobic ribonucleoside-triphosphate reductase [Methanolobus bombayensis]